jgi:hypothetical protein
MFKIAVVVVVLAAIAQATYLPEGYSTFFSSATCPTGWVQIPSAMGSSFDYAVDSSATLLVAARMSQ